jgi:hypothetical protein
LRLKAWRYSSALLRCCSARVLASTRHIMSLVKKISTNYNYSAYNIRKD